MDCVLKEVWFGFRFIVHPRPRTSRRDQPAFKIKSILKGSETDGTRSSRSDAYSLCSFSLVVSRQELVSWLHHEIVEQKKIDLATSGAAVVSPTIPYAVSSKDVSTSSDVHLILPADTKKQRKHVKQLFLDRGTSFFFPLSLGTRCADTSLSSPFFGEL